MLSPVAADVPDRLTGLQDRRSANGGATRDDRHPRRGVPIDRRRGARLLSCAATTSTTRPRAVFEVRIHGRGGQGVVTAAEMLSLAAFDEGRYAQAFPSFGSERMGAPVVSFCRIDDHAIRVREPVDGARRADHPGPDAAPPGRRVRRLQARTASSSINTDQELRRARPRRASSRDFRHERLLTVPAAELAREHTGRPVPNAALLGGFAALSGVISLDAVVARDPRALRRRRRRGQRGGGAGAHTTWVSDELRELSGATPA